MEVLPTPPFWLATTNDARHHAASRNTSVALGVEPRHRELEDLRHAMGRAARARSRRTDTRPSSRSAGRRARRDGAPARRNPRDRRRRATRRRRTSPRDFQLSTRSHTTSTLARPSSVFACCRNAHFLWLESSSVTAHRGPRDGERNAGQARARTDVDDARARRPNAEGSRGCRARAASPSARCSRTAVRLCTRFHFSTSSR